MTARYLAAAGLSLCIILFGYFAYHRLGAHSSSSVTDERSQIGELFKGRSSEEAYALFKETYARASTSDQHGAAHLFGELLYEKEGIQGFSVCDGSFGFGCVHTFIPLALADHGESIVPKFDENCITAFGSGSLGCFHGIGHGLVAYFGYSASDIGKALALCDSLSWKRPYGGCRDGVFMEFNTRLMINDPTQQRNRPFSMGERFVPCTNLEPQSRVACYFELPGWWEISIQDGKKMQEMGSFCAEVKDSRSQAACFRGIGYAHAPMVNFSASDGASECDSLSVTSSQKVQCHEGLAWALWADPTYRDRATTACTQGLTDAQATQCKSEYLFTIQ